MRPPTMKSVKAEYDSRNQEAATVILSDARYQGTIMSEWATTFLLRLERERLEPYPLLSKLAGDIERAA